MKYDITERKYIAISIKFSKPNDLLFWGTRTKENQDRCFVGYNPYNDINDKMCELYSLKDFQDNYGEHKYIKSNEPVPMTDYIIEVYSKFDTVLVCEQDYLHWINMQE